MKRILALALVIGVSTFGLVGCEQETKTKEVKVSEGPNGSVKETKTDKVEATGDAKTPNPTTPEAPK